MRTAEGGLFRKLLRGELGQSAVMVGLTITTMMALAGSSVEVGHIYYAYQRLVASTNAATLAGAQVMPDTGAATTNVNRYSSATVSGVAGYNATPMLKNVVVTTNFRCLNTVSNKMGIACLTTSGTAGGYNALRVTQTASVPLWFGGLIGMPQMNMTAVSTASIKGGTNTPWNIAIILDTTGSMNNWDGVQCNGTQMQCAIQGVRYLLSNLYPCNVGETCTSSSKYVDAVSLFVFPPILKSTAGKDYCSGGTGKPTPEYYQVPALPSSGSSSWVYQLPFGSNAWSNDYRVNDNDSTGLNTTSNIVKAVGGSSSCAGIQAPQNGYTYYAQAIYMAQDALITQQTANKGSQNAMIILSDGDATATASYTYNKWTGVTTFDSNSWLQPSSTGSLNGITGNNPTSWTYPSAVGECGQAVLAAQAATNAGTKVYTIGYGAKTWGGCSSDRNYSPTVTTGGGSWRPGGSPCQALAAMASSPKYFYSDDANGCSATAPINTNLTQLTSIFTQITRDFTNARLIPNDTP
jgi:Flp pilus assembly protein TadG